MLSPTYEEVLEAKRIFEEQNPGYNTSIGWSSDRTGLAVIVYSDVKFPEKINNIEIRNLN